MTAVTAEQKAELRRLRAAWHAVLDEQRANFDADREAELDRAEQSTYDDFADLTDELGRCRSCLADLDTIPNWADAYCLTHAEKDVVREWEAQVQA